MRKLFAAGKLEAVAQNAETFRADTPIERRARMNAAASNPCPVRQPAAFPNEELMANAVNICGRRGYHGPFINEALYNWFGGMWSGQGDCQLCMNTRNVKAEQIAQGVAA